MLFVLLEFPVVFLFCVREKQPIDMEGWLRCVCGFEARGSGVLFWLSPVDSDPGPGRYGARPQPTDDIGVFNPVLRGG